MLNRAFAIPYINLIYWERNMSYKKATNLLPAELLRMVQQYVDGELIYIPRLDANRRDWGQDTSTRCELSARNALIYADHCAGMSTGQLAGKYFLSEKSIQRIVRQARHSAAHELCAPDESSGRV